MATLSRGLQHTGWDGTPTGQLTTNPDSHPTAALAVNVTVATNLLQTPAWRRKGSENKANADPVSECKHSRLKIPVKQTSQRVTQLTGHSEVTGVPGPEPSSYLYKDIWTLHRFFGPIWGHCLTHPVNKHSSCQQEQQTHRSQSMNVLLCFCDVMSSSRTGGGAD